MKKFHFPVKEVYFKKVAKIKIITDSASDVALEKAEALGIHIIPLKLTLDGENYIRDKFDISNAEFFKHIRDTGVVPKTSQILPHEFEEVFKSYEDEYDEIIMITLSSASSGTYNNAKNIAAEVEEGGKIKIHVVDGKSFSFGYGVLAVRAAELAKDGKSSAEIIEEIQKMIENQRVYFAVETLDYLKKGGRISTTTAVIGGMLDIRPILSIKDGLVASVDKVKGEKKLYSKIAEKVKATIEEIPENKVYFLESDNPETSAKLLAALEAVGITPDEKGEVGSLIGSHAGPGVMGIVMC